MRIATTHWLRHFRWKCWLNFISLCNFIREKANRVQVWVKRTVAKNTNWINDTATKKQIETTSTTNWSIKSGYLSTKVYGMSNSFIFFIQSNLSMLMPRGPFTKIFEIRMKKPKRKTIKRVQLKNVFLVKSRGTPMVNFAARMNGFKLHWNTSFFLLAATFLWKLLTSSLSEISLSEKYVN